MRLRVRGYTIAHPVLAAVLFLCRRPYDKLTKGEFV